MSLTRTVSPSKVSRLFFLLAGAGANSTPALGGSLSFSVNASPSYADWCLGSAFKYIMLLAGACADNLSSGGYFSFNVYFPPSIEYWGFGSAI